MNLKTLNHDEIKRWTEERNGQPAREKGTDHLQINFLGYEADIENISWEEFFDLFEKNNLVMIYGKEHLDRHAKFSSREKSRA